MSKQARLIWENLPCIDVLRASWKTTAGRGWETIYWSARPRQHCLQLLEPFRDTYGHPINVW